MTTTYYNLTPGTEANEDGLPEGGDISMRNLDHASHKDGKIVSDSMLIASDYSGNDGGIVRVNVNWWGENFSDQQGTMWWATHGGHGTFGVVVDARVLDESYEWDDEDTAYAAEQMREALESLENYPILDEEAHSELEMQQQNEQFHEAAADDDFAEKIAEALGWDVTGDDARVQPEALQMFYHMIGGDLFSIYPYTEGSWDNLAVVFHFDDFIKKLRDALAALTTMSPYASEQTKTLIAEALFSSSPPPYLTFEYRGQIATALHMGQEFARLNAERKAVVLDFLEEQGDQWVVEHIASGDVFEKLGKAGFSEFSR